MDGLRSDLEPLTERIKSLPIGPNGYPVPWFVAWENGAPEFRAADQRKFLLAIRDRLCWVCGQKLGAHKTFVVGPMCGLNRTTAEPPVHHDCGRWSARNCPFLKNPSMVRRDGGLEGAESPGGIMIRRNPGVVLLWTTKSYSLFNAGGGRALIEIGEPERLEWYCRGKPASLDQVEEAIALGLPAVESIANEEGEKSIAALRRARAKFEDLYRRGFR